MAGVFSFFFGPTSSKIGEVPAMFSYKKGHVPSSSSIPTLDGKWANSCSCWSFSGPLDCCFWVFQIFLQVLEIIFFGISTSQNWHNHRDHSDLKLFAFEVGFFPASHNALRS
jgi:hypothetical protein